MAIRVTLGVLISMLVSLPAHADLVEPDTEYLVFHHRDVLGTAIATTDSNGNVVHHTSTTPYGRDLGRRADDGQGFSDNAYPSSRSGEGYTGHVNDRQLELTYMRARFYDPVLGRFLSNDPVGFTSENPTSFNRYAYANNSPYRFVDPDGRQSRDANWEAAGIDQPGNPVADKAAEIASTASAGVDLVDDIATDPLTYVPGAAGAKAGAAGIGWFGRMKGKFGKTDIPNGPTSASATAGAQAAETATSWSLGPGKSPEKWARQMEKRGWTQSQISEALARGETFSATNNLNPANGATRYVHPSTGRSVVIDNANQQVIHVGGDGFNY